MTPEQLAGEIRTGAALLGVIFISAAYGLAGDHNTAAIAVFGLAWLSLAGVILAASCAVRPPAPIGYPFAMASAAGIGLFVECVALLAWLR